MRLVKIEARGFRSLKQIEIDFEPLTVLIGENDAGKSSILDLLEIFLDKRLPDRQDFYCDLAGTTCPTMDIAMEFDLGPDDGDADDFAINGQLKVKKYYELPNSSAFAEEQTSYFGMQPVDEQLRQDFSKMKAGDQSALIQTLDPTVAAKEVSNASARVAWLTTYVADQAEKEEVWIRADKNWGKFLPRFERYSAMDYHDPARLVAKTLAQSYEQTIYEEIEEADGSTRRQLIEPLRKLQAAAGERIKADVATLLTYIQKYDKRTHAVGYEPEFDFRKSLLPGEFQVNKGRGLHALSRTGDGTKRRMFMGILDWDREISLAQATAGLPPVIRGYDEPDTNLHYGAQQLMYQSIHDIVHGPESNIQAVICTHSLTMINRAPTQNIRLLRLCDEGHSEVEKIDTEKDPDVERFLSTLARELGITNALIFYERCFVLIEGESEENALPIFYQTLYGCSLLEDGIRIINTKGNGAVHLFLQLMGRNRQAATVVFIDRDAENQAPARLTRRTLEEAGFSAEFVDEKIVFIGSQEFEDAFSDDVIVCCLEKHWPKPGGTWCTGDLAGIRSTKKFSSGLGKLVSENYTAGGPYFSKPAFGEKIARLCSPEDIPAEICQLFTLARRISGAEDPAPSVAPSTPPSTPPTVPLPTPQAIG